MPFPKELYTTIKGNVEAGEWFLNSATKEVAVEDSQNQPVEVATYRLVETELLSVVTTTRLKTHKQWQPKEK